jgi:diguanylate cyclase (GGDEF)-like protein/PAS domain S-box-containing protein
MEYRPLRSSTVGRRLIALLVYASLLALFALDPTAWLGEEGYIVLSMVAQLGGPLLAAIVCLLAARRSVGTDRRAWVSFTIGSGLYFAGNILYFGLLAAGYVPSFPSLPEAAYFIMAAFFAVGMFQYGNVGPQINRLQVYNFILVFCAVSLASLFLLAGSVSTSVLSQFGTLAAFLYPAIWFSVAASGLISLLLYRQGSKVFTLALLLVGVLAESAADYSYALQLMSGTFQIGGVTQLLWVASSALIAWAAIEHLARPSATLQVTPRGPQYRARAQAVIPAAAVAIVLVSASFAETLLDGPYVWIAALLSIAFALTTALRETWMIAVQRRLRGSVERSRKQLLRSEERLSAVLESTSDSVLVVDRDWRVVFFNRHAARTIGKPETLREGVSLWELFPAALLGEEGERYRHAIATGEAVRFELYVEDRGVWLGIECYPTSDALSIFFRDISEQRRIREEMRHMAEHDSLTGLANRSLFSQRLSDALAGEASVAVLLLDLDHFKEVNDTLGHPVGDAVLRGTASRLRQCVREGDTVARLGGDEFAVIVTGYTDVAEVRALARRIIDAANRGHEMAGETALVGGSAGISLSGTRDPERLLKEADIALYVAKGDARGGYRIFEPAMESGLNERQALRADLRVGLERQEFELHYQPIVDLKRGEISGFEALLRWRHPRHGLVSPEVFIPLAEETGLILAIGDWALREACAEAARWPGDISVAVNLSTRQFRDNNLVDIISHALDRSGLPPARLELEITESVLLKDSRANLITLRRLRDSGIRIALDDFGTGYSSLGYLQRFPFSKIKIDRSFISGLPQSEESQAIVRAVIGLGRALGMRVTAEGVETAAQLDWIRSGCDEAQGYFLSRPVPADMVPALLEEFSGRTSERARLAS